ncbi:RNA polymerase, sigma-24 subunit, ECF subfamily [Thermobaculum terrenum ATCC BAA-798]|uniref:RNA polymerase, sigma-24 subunit, ECF subfamily n=1 Tax=Thermobaculum terrenum (strain ATCC BAA-798 / CCMEE 7001 / YNP1) TaxID=525904 RepID=D1CIE7_THET1|nr:sigma-70 family RNA polymerase sigma factor [Thermobaculum terrenum]ACZ43518.1 RNA polymerase, sigma-24 subunit, ECF subfamily [Thermobaculum terrenum ATCC BAA-798]
MENPEGTRELLAEMELVRAARDGDKEAFSALVRLYQQDVYRLCYRVLGNHHNAEDASQEVFLRAYDRLKQLESNDKFRSWLMRIAVNICLNERRRRHPITEIEEWHHPDTQDPETNTLRSERLQLVERAIQELPRNHRIALVLKDLEGVDYAQIADYLEVQEGTARVWVYRGRQKLKEIIERWNGT